MKENDAYLSEQIITYIGNKRKLNVYIEAAVRDILREEGREKAVCADLFSGSGIVARMLKQYAERLVVNDLEEYSRVINSCYLTDRKDFDEEAYAYWHEQLMQALQTPVHGLIAENYAPQDMHDIQKGERVFFTPRNAMYIDTVRQWIDTIPRDMQKFFLAPLLYEVSVHTNTSGVFKGFYKDRRTGIGKYGGTGQNALLRIMGDMEVDKPVLSNYEAPCEIYCEDTNALAKKLHGIDIAYLDPPYNQHPYGSNYFMLNTVVRYEQAEKMSRVSGIPKGWNRSVYNKKAKAAAAFEELIRDLDARYIIVSYNSEGFVTRQEMTSILSSYGALQTVEIRYNTFRGSRNLKDRDLYVDEYLFILKKNI